MFLQFNLHSLFVNKKINCFIIFITSSICITALIYKNNTSEHCEKSSKLNRTIDFIRRKYRKLRNRFGVMKNSFILFLYCCYFVLT